MRLSASLIKTYKMCRRKYELKYIEELEPVAKSQALKDGSNYHETLEKFYKGESGVGYFEGCNPKIEAMAMAYTIYIYGKHEELKDEEQEYYDNMPEGIQSSKKGERAEQAVSSLDDAFENIDSAIDSINEAIK